MIGSVEKCFRRWMQVVDERKSYDAWCESNHEELEEANFASLNNMDPKYWCWNCKYSDCDVHNRLT